MLWPGSIEFIAYHLDMLDTAHKRATSPKQRKAIEKKIRDANRQAMEIQRLAHEADVQWEKWAKSIRETDANLH